jgi:O-antigen ligase
VPLIALVVSIALINRVDTRALTERFQSQRPIDYRVEAMTVGIKLAARSPIFGLGLDNYGQAALGAGWRPAEGAAVLVANHPHNLFIYVLTSGGLVALLPLVALYALLLRRGLAWLPDPERRLWGGLVLGMTLGHSVAAASFDVYLAQLANMFYFMIMGALFGAFERKPAQATRGLEHTPEAGA